MSIRGVSAVTRGRGGLLEVLAQVERLVSDESGEQPFVLRLRALIAAKDEPMPLIVSLAGVTSSVLMLT